MYKIDIYDINWNVIRQKELPVSIFNDDNINHDLLHEFIVLQLANKRIPIAHTKTRWEVNYSWRKLYRQKWTWNARVWDAWSPIRRKWWVAFWPRNTINYEKDMPKKQRKKALFSALTLKARDNEILWIDLVLNQIKTKDAYAILKKLNINEKVLLVLFEKDEVIIKSFRNIPYVKYIIVDYINPYDLLTHKKVLFMEKAIDRLEEIFTNK